MSESGLGLRWSAFYSMLVILLRVFVSLVCVCWLVLGLCVSGDLCAGRTTIKVLVG